MDFLISIFVYFYSDLSSITVTLILASCDSASANRPRSRSTTFAGALSVNPGLPSLPLSPRISPSAFYLFFKPGDF